MVKKLEIGNCAHTGIASGITFLRLIWIPDGSNTGGGRAGPGGDCEAIGEAPLKQTWVASLCEA